RLVLVRLWPVPTRVRTLDGGRTADDGAIDRTLRHDVPGSCIAGRGRPVAPQPEAQGTREQGVREGPARGPARDPRRRPDAESDYRRSRRLGWPLVARSQRCEPVVERDERWLSGGAGAARRHP